MPLHRSAATTPVALLRSSVKPVSKSLSISRRPGLVLETAKVFEYVHFDAFRAIGSSGIGEPPPALAAIDPDELLSTSGSRRAARHLVGQIGSPLRAAARSMRARSQIADFVVRAVGAGRVSEAQLEHAAPIGARAAASSEPSAGVER